MRENGIKVAFIVVGAACLLPWTPPWAALIGGMVLAIAFGNPFAEVSKKGSKVLLQLCVILLGFAVNLNIVLKAGMDGLLFALFSIAAVFLLGWLTQKLLKVRPITSLLVATGTAICGGSAIAGMSTVVDAPQEDVSVSVGTIFLLNAVALVVFPQLGHALGLTQAQFGTWSGIAIHDVASVVGAGKSYDDLWHGLHPGMVADSTAQTIATAVKLSRVLYLIPITLIAAVWQHRNRPKDEGKAARPTIPWFIGGFLLASLLTTKVPAAAEVAPTAKVVASAGLALALFLIGAGITRKTLKAVGARPLIQGVILWIFISVAALVVVKAGVGG